MRIWVDTAVPAEIEEWDEHPWVSGFTTNPTLISKAGSNPREIVNLAKKPISIDGDPETVWGLGPHTIAKVPVSARSWLPPERSKHRYINWTAICYAEQIQGLQSAAGDILSIFAGRIADTGRDPVKVIQKIGSTRWTGRERRLWASVREPYNIIQAEQAGCDIVTVPPAILRKYLDWHGKPLETVAEETIAQFRRDAEGITW